MRSLGPSAEPAIHSEPFWHILMVVAERRQLRLRQNQLLFSMYKMSMCKGSKALKNMKEKEWQCSH